MSAQVTILQLPAAGAITGSEAVPIVQNGVTVQTTTGAIANSPTQTYSYLTVSQTPQLPNSRYVGATNGLTLTDGGAQGLFNISTTGALLSLVNSSAGFQVKTSSTAITNRSIAVTGAGLSITNGDGISGNPTIGLSGQVLNLANYSGNGILTITTGGAISTTLIQGTTSQIAVTNGNAIGGYPTVGIASNPTLPGSAGVVLPSGSTGDRSVAPTNGTLRYNTTIALLEAYLNNSWATLASGSGVTSILTGTGLTGGPITSTGTISIADTAVTTGTYGNSTNVAQFTVNQQGQLTFAGNVAISASSIGAVTTINGTPNEISATGASTVTLSLPSALTFTGKTVTGGTFSSPNIATIINTGTLTLPTSTDTLVGRATTDTLTNKSISGSTNTLTNIPNSALTNSSVTVGTTNIALGATSLTLGGLTSVTVTQDPSTALQLATKQYVDGLVSTGLAYHQPVQVATTQSLAAQTGGTVTYNNGASGVGATITLSVALTVLDGYTLLNTNRILVKNEVNQAYNGVYTWATGGTVLTRSTDTNSYGPGTSQLSEGDYFFTQNGTVNAGNSYVCSTVGTITFGTTAITFAQFSTSQVYTGTSPISVSGTVISLTTVPANLGGTSYASYSTGDMLYASGTTALSKLTIGASGYVLTSSGTAPQYVAQSTLAVGSATNTGTTASSAAATHYLVFKSATSGNLPELVNSSISVYPSTGVITGGISGGTF